MIKRREFLGLMSTSPLFAKKATEDMSMKLSKIKAEYGSQSISHQVSVNRSTTVREELNADHYKMAMSFPIAREKIREQLFAQNQKIYSIDNDLASKRSFSLAAKICYQRQRDVEARLREMEMGSDPWDMVRKIVKGAVGL